MPTKRTLFLAASLLILAGLVLIVVGLGRSGLLWRLGLGALALALLISFATRFVGAEEVEVEEGDEGEAPAGGAPPG